MTSSLAQIQLPRDSSDMENKNIDYIKKAENVFLENLDSAIIYLQLGIDYYGERKNWEEYINCLNGIASCHYYKGEYAKALEFVNKSIENTKKYLGPKSSAFASALNNLAKLQEDLGDYDLALENYRKVILLDQESNNVGNLVTAHNNIGSCLEKKGDIEEAIEYFKKSLRLINNKSPVDHIVYAQCYELIAGALLLKGEFEESFDMLLKSIEIFQGLEKSQGDMIGLRLIRSHWNLAKVALELDNNQDYITHSLEAKKLEKKYNKNQSPTSFSLLGSSAIKNNQPVLARKHFSQKLQAQNRIYEGIALHPELGKTYSQIAQSYFNESDFPQSVDFFHKALLHYSKDSVTLDIFENPKFDQIIIDNEAINILHGKAQSLYQFSKSIKSEKDQYLTAAVNTFDLAILAINHLRKDLFSTTSKATLSEKSAAVYQDALNCILELYNESPSDKLFQKAFQLVESGKAAILLESINEITAKGFAGIPDSLIARDGQLKRQISNYQQRLYALNKEGKANSKQIEFIESKLFETKNIHQEFLAMLEVNYPNYYQLKYNQRLASLKDIQALLPDQQSAFIEYFLGVDKLHIFYITKKNAEIQTVDIENNLEAQVTALRDFLHQPPNHFTAENDFAQYSDIAHQLYLLLIEPLVIDKNIDRLIVVPDDLIGYIPFEVLLQKPVKESKVNYHPNHLNYLINDYNISYHYSATLWKQKKVGQRGNGFLGLAPTFKAVSTEEMVLRDCREEDLYQLKCNEEEVNLIGTLIPGVTLNGIQATKDKFLQNAADYQVLHFATHSCLDDENPMLNKIFLSGDYISNYDLYNIRLNADLVVLSACNTGNGPLLKGEGVMSLFRGFLHAGCPSSLLSFWSVEDCTTKGIMKNYYEELSNGVTKDKALKSAKIDFLQNADRLHAHPFYWAPFVQFGNISPLDFTASFSLFSWRFVFLYLSVILILFSVFKFWRK